MATCWIFVLSVILLLQQPEAKHIHIYIKTANQTWENDSIMSNEDFNRFKNFKDAKLCSLCIKTPEDPNTSNCYKDGVYHLFFHSDGEGREKKIYSPISIKSGLDKSDEWCYINITFKNNLVAEDQLFVGSNKTFSCNNKWRSETKDLRKTQYNIVSENSKGE